MRTSPIESWTPGSPCLPQRPSLFKTSRPSHERNTFMRWTLCWLGTTSNSFRSMVVYCGPSEFPPSNASNLGRARLLPVRLNQFQDRKRIQSHLGNEPTDFNVLG